MPADGRWDLTRRLKGQNKKKVDMFCVYTQTVLPQLSNNCTLPCIPTDIEVFSLV